MTPESNQVTALPLSALSHYVRWYDAALPAEFCKGLIDGFEQMTEAHVENGRGVRSGLEGSKWTEINMSQYADEAMKGFFITQMDEYLARYNADVGLGLSVPPSNRMADLGFKRYTASQGDGFQPHFDAIYEKSDRYMVFLWYLNDVAEGGETRFTDLDFAVQPRAGRLLMFPPFWMYQHAGMPPISNDKYIISTYLLFEKTHDLSLKSKS
ncbi:MAG TPA: 2OG-Fe(II) oxygenase [Dokdonella sp.]|uniref:2OG-Fe(II) oxygenase n=1 Tax=Dokdonella sp. TaxID=2291710 RepID=UPI002D7FD169|nr:2OG-Fe(II) oxygenase [Dokdonella sp.]HET9031677.1 2OG-Fe(II) oxygenase [Dokdonella sp.]